ncbi:MAG: histidinol dehydrogenase, partial [Proteobacteria bacterium]|nr:histidinol dehydrogenase [Pseudomonadota bacterium]
MIQIKRFNSTDPDFDSKLDKLLAFEGAQDDVVDSTVAKILADIKIRKDAALIEYTNRFDRLNVASAEALELTQDDLQQALAVLPSTERTALQQAAGRVRSYHEKQPLSSWQYTDADDTLLGQKITPLDRVGLYVPGGKASYPSSVLMNAIPAKVAGVKELIMVVPTPDGERNDMVLAAAAISKVDRVFTIGGAQAVGALAYGTETVPPVDKIVGPGNAYVNEAKRQVFGTVGIDQLAGPSEIFVVADRTANPDMIATDLLAQAEHDVRTRVGLITTDLSLANATLAAVERQLPSLPTANVAGVAWRDYGEI